MYINNGWNILTTSDLRLAKEYFKQIRQTLNSLHYLLFGNQALLLLLLPESFLPPLPLAFSFSRSSFGAIPRRPLSSIPRSASSIPRLPIHTSRSTSSIPRLSTYTSQTKIPKAPVKVKTKMSSPNKPLKRLNSPIPKLRNQKRLCIC